VLLAKHMSYLASLFCAVVGKITPAARGEIHELVDFCDAPSGRGSRSGSAGPCSSWAATTPPW
jgi:hypothetical protein